MQAFHWVNHGEQPVRSLLVELYLPAFTDFLSRVSLVNKIIYLFYACTSTSISSRISVFQYFLHTFPIILVYTSFVRKVLRLSL